MKALQQEVSPSLRFKDEQGRDYPEWISKNLDNVAEVVRGVTFGKGDVVDIWQSGRIPVLRAGNIGDELILHQELIWLLEEYISPVQWLRKRDIVMCASSGSSSIVGKCAIVRQDWKGTIGAFCFIIRVNSLKCNPEYSAYFLKSSKFRRWTNSAAGTNIKNIRMGDLRKYLIAFPSHCEQQKIASFLSSVDRKIQQLIKKKELLEQYKKGMMQKLFRQEIRFKDEQGKEYSEWKARKFDELYEFKSTNSIARKNLNYVDERGVRNIHYGDIHTKFKTRFNLEFEIVPFINADIDLKNVSEEKFCQEGDLVIADASEDYSGVGKTIELIDLKGEQVLAGLHTLLARLKSCDMYVGYGAYVMSCQFVRHQIMNIAQGTKVLGISATRMKKIVLPLACKQEQQKIASFLSSIDRKIELVGEQIELTQTFKKGLLQQMFV